VDGEFASRTLAKKSKFDGGCVHSDGKARRKKQPKKPLKKKKKPTSECRKIKLNDVAKPFWHMWGTNGEKREVGTSKREKRGKG